MCSFYIMKYLIKETTITYNYNNSTETYNNGFAIMTSTDSNEVRDQLKAICFVTEEQYPLTVEQDNLYAIFDTPNDVWKCLSITEISDIEYNFLLTHFNIREYTNDSRITFGNTIIL